jgi:hypothetical protein
VEAMATDDASAPFGLRVPFVAVAA